MAACDHPGAPSPGAFLAGTGEPESWDPEYGPWVTAGFDSDCDGCGGGIYEGMQTRSDGSGGWLCEICGSEEE
jgi:hypothetical protein